MRDFWQFGVDVAWFVCIWIGLRACQGLGDVEWVSLLFVMFGMGGRNS